MERRGRKQSYAERVSKELTERTYQRIDIARNALNDSSDLNVVQPITEKESSRSQRDSPDRQNPGLLEGRRSP